jgi:hypothetical protein
VKREGVKYIRGTGDCPPVPPITKVVRRWLGDGVCSLIIKPVSEEGYININPQCFRESRQRGCRPDFSTIKGVGRVECGVWLFLDTLFFFTFNFLASRKV